MMTDMYLSLSDAMRQWVDAQIMSGRYSDPSDYVRELIRRDQELQRRREALGRALDEGEASGISERSLEQLWADVNRQLGDPDSRK
jgi:antitoxin ParD1/3/4